ncbi:hypothetical protein L291_3996 [Acinetobacter guillouiae MSP4-18]|nr:hypothetical protein L291_3996 [Acinetobacter guillouiae MSP4-18]
MVNQIDYYCGFYEHDLKHKLSYKVETAYLHEKDLKNIKH